MFLSEAGISQKCSAKAHVGVVPVMSLAGSGLPSYYICNRQTGTHNDGSYLKQ